MTPIDYNSFVANVNEDDLAMLTSFLVGVEVLANTPELGDALFVQAQRLYNAGMITDVSRRYYDTGTANAPAPVTWQGFLGKLHPVAVGYVGRLARERVMLSRDPIPA